MKAQELRPKDNVPKQQDSELKEVLKANDLLHNNNRQKQLKNYEDLLNIKRDREESSRRLRPLFLNIGMALSLILVTMAMNWKSYDRAGIVDLGELEVDAEEIIEIPISQQPPPPPPKKMPEVFTIKEVDDSETIEEIEVTLDVDVQSNEAIEQYEYVAPEVEIEEETVDEVFAIVENQPEPVGGIAAFNKYVAESIRYPATAARMNVSGMVFVKFVVEKDGSLTDAQVVKGIGAGCDEEAIRVINGAPKWKPGKQRGKAVRVYKIVPIRFVLRD